MFVITELEDKVEVRAAARDKKASIIEQLNKKYSKKLVGDLGQAIAIYNIIDIKNYEIHCHILVANVIFQVLFYRFYPEEVCTGKIVSQDEDGIVLDDGTFKHYEVHPEDLFEDCEYVANGASGQWIWNYEGNKLIFYNGDTVRFRIKELNAEESTVLVYMNEQGLGPCSWWD